MAHIVNEKGQALPSTALHTVALADSETVPDPQPLIPLEALHEFIVDSAWANHCAFQEAQRSYPDLLWQPLFLDCRDDAFSMYFHLFGCLAARTQKMRQ